MIFLLPLRPCHEAGVETETVGPAPFGFGAKGKPEKRGGLDRHMDLDFFSSEFRFGGDQSG